MKNSNILLCALIGTLIMPVMAQQEKPKPQIKRVPLQVAPGGQQVRPGIIRRPQLDLTEDQQKQLQEIRQAYSESVRELFQNKDLTLEDRRDQAKDLRDDLNLQIEAVYTPEQKAKLAKYKDEQAKRLEELRKNRPAVRPRIQLDEKQQKAMLKLRQEHAKKMQAAFGRRPPLWIAFFASKYCKSVRSAPSMHRLTVSWCIWETASSQILYCRFLKMVAPGRGNWAE